MVSYLLCCSCVCQQQLLTVSEVVSNQHQHLCVCAVYVVLRCGLIEQSMLCCAVGSSFSCPLVDIAFTVASNQHRMTACARVLSMLCCAVVSSFICTLVDIAFTVASDQHRMTACARVLCMLCCAVGSSFSCPLVDIAFTLQHNMGTYHHRQAVTLQSVVGPLLIYHPADRCRVC